MTNALRNSLFLSGGKWASSVCFVISNNPGSRSGDSQANRALPRQVSAAWSQCHSWQWESSAVSAMQSEGALKAASTELLFAQAVLSTAMLMYPLQLKTCVSEHSPEGMGIHASSHSFTCKYVLVMALPAPFSWALCGHRLCLMHLQPQKLCAQVSAGWLETGFPLQEGLSLDLYTQ